MQFPLTVYDPEYYIDKLTACVHVAIKLIYQDHNVPSSKIQSKTLAMLLFEKHYLTDSQFLHPRKTFARNVTNIC